MDSWREPLIFASVPLVLALIPAILGYLLGRMRADWSAGRCAFLAATLCPALIAGSSIYLIVDASNAPREACGVDACGVAVASGMFMLFVSLIIFAVGFVIALLVQRLVLHQ